MDDKKKVVSWKLTRGEGHGEITDSLREIQRRLTTPLLYVICDKCCHDRFLYKDVFGPEITVKLDIFHAIQRLTDCIPARCKHRKKICNDIALFVRQSGDWGDSRGKDTADPAEMDGNLLQIKNSLSEAGMNLYVVFKEMLLKQKKIDFRFETDR